jgi:hypothetical protein
MTVELTAEQRAAVERRFDRRVIEMQLGGAARETRLELRRESRCERAEIDAARLANLGKRQAFEIEARERRFAFPFAARKRREVAFHRLQPAPAATTQPQRYARAAQLMLRRVEVDRGEALGRTERERARNARRGAR